MSKKNVTTLRKNFGMTVKIMRIKKEMNQEEMAEKSNLHPSYFGSIERGERNVTFDTIISIARALECSPKDLMPED